MRDDPTGKRALFSGSSQSEDFSDDGKQALFSERDRSPGLISIECGTCRATTRVAVTDAISRILAFSLWVPGKSFSRRLRCPACQRRAWVRIRIS